MSSLDERTALASMECCLITLSIQVTWNHMPDKFSGLPSLASCLYLVHGLPSLQKENIALFESMDLPYDSRFTGRGSRCFWILEVLIFWTIRTLHTSTCVDFEIFPPLELLQYLIQLSASWKHCTSFFHTGSYRYLNRKSVQPAYYILYWQE